MNKIQYTLRGVSIEQFATPFEPSSDNIQLSLNIPVRTNYQERSFAIGANIQFLEEDKPFLVAEVFCAHLHVTQIKRNLVCSSFRYSPLVVIQVGSAEYFYCMFKKSTGLTPHEYRSYGHVPDTSGG